MIINAIELIKRKVVSEETMKVWYVLPIQSLLSTAVSKLKTSANEGRVCGHNCCDKAQDPCPKAIPVLPTISLLSFPAGGAQTPVKNSK